MHKSLLDPETKPTSNRRSFANAASSTTAADCSSAERAKRRVRAIANLARGRIGPGWFCNRVQRCSRVPVWAEDYEKSRPSNVHLRSRHRRLPWGFAYRRWRAIAWRRGAVAAMVCWHTTETTFPGPFDPLSFTNNLPFSNHKQNLTLLFTCQSRTTSTYVTYFSQDDKKKWTKTMHPTFVIDKPSQC